MRKSFFLLIYALIVAFGFSPCRAQILQTGGGDIPLGNYAALELQRYYYQLSGSHLPIIKTDEVAASDVDFILATLDNPVVKKWIDKEGLSGKELPGEQGYLIRTFEKEGHHTVAVIGTDSYGLLYGVYGLLEDHFGMRFYLNEDVFPKQKKTVAQLSAIEESRTPKMRIRGFLPWTNFPQSATIYSWSDWRYIIDQTAKMRMNFILIHNYNGFCGHNEMFHNFEYNDYVSRGWMPTIKTGHGWSCPGWEINDYCFGASDIYDDYDFGADCALHNETLTNGQIKEKGEIIFQKVIEYAHQRGVKIGLGLDIDVILSEYQVQADERSVITAQTKQIARAYPDLDYLFCFQSEGNNKDSVFYNKWQRVFDGFYEDMKSFSPHTRMVVSGWGLTAESVNKLPEDVICAPISHYSAQFESGKVYGEREYWGCPWLERDWNSSQYYYPYNMDLSETISAYEEAAPNMNGFYALTWRLADAVSPKMWYISKAPWYVSEQLDSSEKVYGDYAKANYGELAAEKITPIINQNEPFSTDFAECQVTPAFDQTVNTYPLMNLDSLILLNGAGQIITTIDATDYQNKKGTKDAQIAEGDSCVGYIMSGDWLEYGKLSLQDNVSSIVLKVSSASNGGTVTISANALDGPAIAAVDVKNTGGWEKWNSIAIPVAVTKDIQSLYIHFHAFNDIVHAVEKADRQLLTIEDCINKAPHADQKMRLSYVYKRIEGAKLHSILNDEFKNYQWESLPGRMDEWVQSFLYRINDISSKGNIMSVQNRFVQQNYIKKVKELRKYQQVKAPSYIVAKRTLRGALVTWRNEEPSVDYFVVSRNGEEIASVPCDITWYNDEYNGDAVYTVCAVDTDKKRSPNGIPSCCSAGNADDKAPFIINPSPVTSINKGENIDIKLSIVDNSLDELLSAVLYYRGIGSNEKWISLPFKHRVRSIFTVTIPSRQVPSNGIEYYIEVSDSRNKAVYPICAPEQLHTVIVIENEEEKISTPIVKAVNGKRLQWEKVSDANMYRIYRGRTSKFMADACSFVTFVGNNTTTFKDNGLSMDGTPLKGDYYYRIAAVNGNGIESNASKTIKISY